MQQTDSCQCGHIQFEIDGDIIAAVMCFCTECQKVSSGVATMSVGINRKSFKLVSGTLKQWERSSDSGARNIAHFCPECGNRIFHEDPDKPDIIRLKRSIIGDEAALEPDAYVWMRSAPDWVCLPKGAVQIEKQPGIVKLLSLAAKRRGKQLLSR